MCPFFFKFFADALGGNLAYDCEFLVFAWIVSTADGQDVDSIRRSLFNVGQGAPASNVFKFPVCKKKILCKADDASSPSLNPCQKPWRLIQRFVEYFTVAGDSVLDLCSGTGTGAITCFLTNRDCVAVELDELQFKLMPSRLLLAFKYLKENEIEETGRLKLEGNSEL